MATLVVSSSFSSSSIQNLSASQTKTIKYHPSSSRITTKRFGLGSRIVSLSSSVPETPLTSSTPHSIPKTSSGDSPNYAIANPNGDATLPNPMAGSAETTIERVIYDFRFLALLAVAGSLAGSVLCFLNGCVYIRDAYVTYWTSCVKGVHTGQMVLRLVEAIDVYLAGTVMLIFAMGLYGLFISNVPPDVHPSVDRSLKGSSLFGMFALKERPVWMKISSLDELKTKVGHVIVMILLVKMFERSKMVTISTGLDLLSYAVATSRKIMSPVGEELPYSNSFERALCTHSREPCNQYLGGQGNKETVRRIRDHWTEEYETKKKAITLSCVRRESNPGLLLGRQLS